MTEAHACQLWWDSLTDSDKTQSAASMAWIGWRASATQPPAASQPTALSIEEASEPDAWLFTCKKPGKVMRYASVDENDTYHWPMDEWKSVVKTPLYATPQPPAASQTIGYLHLLKELMMASNEQLAASLQAISDQLDADSTALQKEINDLSDAVKAAGGTSPAVDALVTSLMAKAVALGKIVPVAAPAPVPTPAPVPAPTPTPVVPGPVI